MNVYDGRGKTHVIKCQRNDIALVVGKCQRGLVVFIIVPINVALVTVISVAAIALVAPNRMPTG